MFSKYKFNLLFALLSIILIISGCKKAKSEEEITSEIYTSEVLAHVLNEVPLNSDYICYLSDTEDWKDFAGDFLTFDDKLISSISDIAIVSSSAAIADEYVIIKTSDVEAIKDALSNHLQKRTGDFTGYVPEEEAKLKKVSVCSYGDYVALLVCDNHSKAVKAFKEAVKPDFKLSDSDLSLLRELMGYEDEATTEVTPGDDNSDDTSNENFESNYDIWIRDIAEAGEDATRVVLSDGSVVIKEIPGVIEPYDTSKIVEAYKTGDSGILTDPKDIAVLNKCIEVIENEITPDMSEYQKELVIHDYIVKNTSYDKKCLLLSDWYSEYSDQPYGCLIDNRAICLGYASTFKLFMDMLDIECIIVKGTANYDYANHAWNMVKLDDGCWYNVDVTWASDYGNEIDHTFFNSDDKLFLDTNHHWEQEEYPSANGGKYEGGFAYD